MRLGFGERSFRVGRKFAGRRRRLLSLEKPTSRQMFCASTHSLYDGQSTVVYTDASRRGTRVSDVFPAFLSFLLYEQVSRPVRAHLPAAQCKRVILLLRVVCPSVRLSGAGVPFNKSTPNNAGRLVAFPLLVCRSVALRCRPVGSTVASRAVINVSGIDLYGCMALIHTVT